MLHCIVEYFRNLLNALLGRLPVIEIADADEAIALLNDISGSLDRLAVDLEDEIDETDDLIDELIEYREGLEAELSRHITNVDRIDEVVEAAAADWRDEKDEQLEFDSGAVDEGVEVAFDTHIAYPFPAASGEGLTIGSERSL